MLFTHGFYCYPVIQVCRQQLPLLRATGCQVLEARSILTLQRWNLQQVVEIGRSMTSVGLDCNERSHTMEYGSISKALAYLVPYFFRQQLFQNRQEGRRTILGYVEDYSNHHEKGWSCHLQAGVSEDVSEDVSSPMEGPQAACMIGFGLEGCS
ncbi:hypothetical protein OUZ56_033819 [Daphnia magna]|uniref:Uncharacterized protein n=1 Tax=Daphnia magna TaxID=35525 RepID=A0ABR0BB54_9CRUS|nr:hypothetical protein OUZ56_033819 [Daphnia magna]